MAITSHGRTSVYFVSAQEFAEFERLRAYERRVHRIEDLPDDVFDAIASSKMDTRHDPLNSLLDE